MPATIVTLILLFYFQRRGTAGIGAVFGPIMALWFIVIAVSGAVGIAHRPAVLFAINPIHAIRFFVANRGHGFLVLGAVFLVCTGGEALYADMGQFGRKSIRFGWFVMVLPALLINYFGQGAILLTQPAAVNHPFYMLAPPWALYPVVALATVATVIASQAIISGAFSLTRQAALLGDLPRLHVVQTSHVEIGQVYIPIVNSFLMIATIVLVVAFRSSDNLAAAYGVAVSMTMVITTLLAHVAARRRWHWSFLTAGAVTCGLLMIDFSFLVGQSAQGRRRRVGADGGRRGGLCAYDDVAARQDPRSPQSGNQHGAVGSILEPRRFATASTSFRLGRFPDPPIACDTTGASRPFSP